MNQAHPKINGRIRMGVDVAKQRMIRGEPFILKVKYYSLDYSKTCVKQPLKNRQNKDLNDKC